MNATPIKIFNEIFQLNLHLHYMPVSNKFKF